MTEIVVSHPVMRVELDPNAVLSEAWRLYKRLFARSVLMGAIVFGVIELVVQLAHARHGAWLGLLTILLWSVGNALLQGGLVEIVRGLHVDGNDDASVAEAFRRASGKAWKLFCVSFLAGVGVALGSILFLFPGLMLATRWAIAVPIAVLEPGSVRGAMRRSRAMLDGNGWNVFKVLFACWALTLIVEVPVGLASLGLPPFGRWITATLALALTTPFTAHALIVVYYALLAPGRPVAQEPGKTWESVWTAQDSVDPAEPPTTQPSTTDPRVETLEEEQLRKFEERERQWGG